MLLPDYRNSKGEWAVTKRVDGTLVFTRGGKLWNNMQQRAKLGGSRQEADPAYSGVTSSFDSANDFISWARCQKGYEHADWALDKDLLSKRNRVYCKELCVFVPVEINNFCVRAVSRRGAYPIGVSWDIKYLNFKAKINKNSATVNLGAFDTPEAAFQAYKTAKQSHARELAAKWQEMIDPRAYDALLNFTVEITD